MNDPISPGSVMKLVGGWISRYRELSLPERLIYTTWSAAVVATLLGLVGVSIYQVAASQPQSESCTVTAVSPSYSTVAGHLYRFVDTSCGKYRIRPGNTATRELETDALEPAAPDSLARTGSPSSGARFILTFEGWGSDRKLISARFY